MSTNFGGRTSSCRRCSWLPQWQGASKAIISQAALDDGLDGWVLGELALEYSIAHSMADETEVGHRHTVAVAIASRRRVARKMHLVSVEACREPVARPSHPCCVVEIEGTTKMIAHAWHD